MSRKQQTTKRNIRTAKPPRLAVGDVLYAMEHVNLAKPCATCERVRQYLDGATANDPNWNKILSAIVYVEAVTK